MVARACARARNPARSRRSWLRATRRTSNSGWLLLAPGREARALLGLWADGVVEVGGDCLGDQCALQDAVLGRVGAPRGVLRRRARRASRFPCVRRESAARRARAPPTCATRRSCRSCSTSPAPRGSASTRRRAPPATCLLSNGDADVQFNIRGKRTPFLSHHVDFPDFGSESPPGSGSSECPQLRALLGG